MKGVWKVLQGKWRSLRCKRGRKRHKESIKEHHRDLSTKAPRQEEEKVCRESVRHEEGICERKGEQNSRRRQSRRWRVVVFAKLTIMVEATRARLSSEDGVDEIKQSQAARVCVRKIEVGVCVDRCWLLAYACAAR